MTAEVLTCLRFALGMGLLLLPCRVIGQPALPVQVPSDKSLVVFVQGANFLGGLYQGTTMLVGADKNSWGYALLQPGRQKLWGCGPERDVVFVAGATHYFLCDILMSTLPEDEARAFLAELSGPTSGEPFKKPERAYKTFMQMAERYEWHSVPAIPSSPRPTASDGWLAVPASTPVDLELVEMVTSALTPPGAQVWLQVAEDVAMEGQVWLPAGSMVRGALPQVKRRAGPAIGSFELVVPSVDANGVRVPLVGQFFSAARHRAKAMNTALLLGGPLAVLMVGGNNAFELPGTRIRMWTREETWIPRAGAAASAAVAPDAQRESMRARALFDVKFNPQGDSPPSAITFLIESPIGLSEVKLVAARGRSLPEYPSAQQVAHDARGWIATFDGWSLLRFTGVSAEPIPLRLAGTLSDGRQFVADTSLKVIP